MGGRRRTALVASRGYTLCITNYWISCTWVRGLIIQMDIPRILQYRMRLNDVSCIKW